LSEIGREKYVHDFIGESRRSEKRPKSLDSTSCVASFLFEFPSSGIGWIFSPLKLSRAELHKPLRDRNAPIAHKHQNAVIANCNHGDRTGMPHHIAHQRWSLGAIGRERRREFVTFHPNDRANMGDGDLRIGSHAPIIRR
jgi:hypothetical protein